MSALLAAYLVVLGLLFVYGARGYVMAFLATRVGPEPPPPALLETPLVTIQLPIYNEKLVLTRLLAAVADLDWPRDRMQIQLLDDSDDDTRALAAVEVARWRSSGFEVEHLTRSTRTEYKAGALRHALPLARGDLIAIFDADFVPGPDFLRQTVPRLVAGERLACVQGRWGHVNRDYSWLTRAQALGVDGHFAVEQRVRSAHGLLMNFNGTAGVWRKEAIVDGGGWTGDTVAEDLDLSYRVQLRGWRIAYCNDAVAPAEIPVQVQSLKRQQQRWAKGSIQCLRKHGWNVLRSRRLRPAQKLEAILHLSHYLVHPLMVALAALLLPVALVAPSPLVVAATLFGATFGPPVMYLVGQRLLHPEDWLARSRALLPLTLVGVGIALSNSRAVAEGLLRRGGEFRRTPKFRIEKRLDTWRGSSYALPVDWTLAGEATLAATMIVAIAVGTATQRYALLPWAFLFAASFATVFVMSIVHRPQARRRRARHAAVAE